MAIQNFVKTILKIALKVSYRRGDIIAVFSTRKKEVQSFEIIVREKCTAVNGIVALHDGHDILNRQRLETVHGLAVDHCYIAIFVNYRGALKLKVRYVRLMPLLGSY